MAWPQITIIVLMALGIGINIAKHGEPKRDTYSMFWAIFGVSVHSYLLYAGGFFN